MASSANVNTDLQWRKLSFFPRYHDPQAKGVDIFAQQLQFLEGIYCFPPFPIVGMALKFLEQQQKDCVMVVPAINAPWVNLMSSYIVDLMVYKNPLILRFLLS